MKGTGRSHILAVMVEGWIQLIRREWIDLCGIGKWLASC